MLNQTPRVFNRWHKDAPYDAVYIGRGSPYGNPYSHIDYPNVILVGSREEACDRFDEDVEKDKAFKQMVRDTLRGKDLVCSCYPKRCHGDTLIRVANEEV